MDTLNFIKENKLVAIARKVRVEDIVNTAKALYDGGIRLMEITFNQESSNCIEDTVSSIRAVKEALGNRMCVGAGTVITIEQAEAAKEAGADFALAPNTDPDVIGRIKELGMVAVPGAMTPSEIVLAWRSGADIVKLFPANNLGLDYVKAIKGPIGHIPLMAVGGINNSNVSTYLSHGFCSCGIGSCLVRNDLISSGDFDSLRKLADEYVGSVAMEIGK
jgi:2-dehydro-3-deoxyphosphogluconate aldolase/(4S)-4-hydroxy-2-oxoglutarate aldolase